MQRTIAFANSCHDKRNGRFCSTGSAEAVSGPSVKAFVASHHPDREMSKDELETFRQYTMLYFGGINGALRGKARGELIVEGSSQDAIRRVEQRDKSLQMAEMMKGYIEECAPLRSPIKVKRTILTKKNYNDRYEDRKVREQLSNLSKMEPGSTFTERGFSSTTSKTKPFAYQVAEIVLDITVPKGKKVLSIDSVKGLSKLKEDEILLPPNTTYKIVGGRTEKGITFIEVEVV